MAAKEDGDEGLKLIGQAVLMPFGLSFAIVVMAPLLLYSAFVAQRFWGWFVAPAFGVPVPGLFAVMGLMMLVRLAIVKIRTHDDTPEEVKVKRWLAATWFDHAMTISVFWLMGWLVHLANGWFAY